MCGMLPVIVIPTYNESENIEGIVQDILNLECGVSILIVDDNSPDGTGEIADRLSEELPEVHVRHLSLIHISEPTRLGMISYAVFCLKKKKKNKKRTKNNKQNKKKYKNKKQQKKKN